MGMGMGMWMWMRMRMRMRRRRRTGGGGGEGGGRGGRRRRRRLASASACCYTSFGKQSLCNHCHSLQSPQNPRPYRRPVIHYGFDSFIPSFTIEP